MYYTPICFWNNFKPILTCVNKYILIYPNKGSDNKRSLWPCLLVERIRSVRYNLNITLRK